MPIEQPAILRLENAGRTSLAVIRRFVGRQARAAGLPEEAVDDLVLAIDEAATNAIVHGYRDRPGPLEVEFAILHEEGGESARLTMRDWAEQFDPRQVPPPDLSRPLHQRKAGGMGVHLIRQCIDTIDYRVVDGANELSLMKIIKKGPPDKGSLGI